MTEQATKDRKRCGGGCGRVARGAAGMTRAALAALTGSGRAPGTLYRLRVDACKPCPSRDARTNSCRECGCFIGPKALLASEKCPKGVWPA